ncbi:MAG: heavy metal-binding domain-containing protein [Thermoleophilia bacterium]
MGLFSRDDDDTPPPPPGAPQADAQQLDAIAEERLRGRAWTSDLSPDELLCVRQAGFAPLGLVLGTCVYHLGLQNSNWSQNQELEVLTQAMYHARELAMTRLEAEAHQLDADGVVGVRLEITRYEWGADLAEFKAIGTAVRDAGGTSRRNAHGSPFTSALSGQDLLKLRVAGLMPARLVFGSCVYHVAHRSLRQTLSNFGRNVEMTLYSQALYDARELAMGRMQHEADAAGAVGIVGAGVDERSHGWGSHVIEFLAYGTAVVDAPAVDPGALGLTLPLSG